jgi:hypothetical protein
MGIDQTNVLYLWLITIAILVVIGLVSYLFRE